MSHMTAIKLLDLCNPTQNMGIQRYVKATKQLNLRVDTHIYKDDD